jgi:N6-adenosine-specific RNA methylase IME4
MKKRSKQSPRQRELNNRRKAAARKTKRRSPKPSVSPRSASANKPAGWVAGEDYSSRVEQPSLPPNRIIIGARHRKDLGDIKALAAGINEFGLIHPIVIDLKNKLIAGARRLAAWQQSNFRDHAIPVHIVPLADIVAGEWAENDPAQRKDFLPSEAVAIKREIETRLKPIARARQVQAGRDKTKLGDTERAGERAASFTGKSRRTIEKAEAIVDAAERAPKKYGRLKEDMDRTGRVDGPFKRLRTMEQADKIRKEPPPLPGNGPYRAIVADPPWAAEPEDDDPERLARGYYPYPTMSIGQIAAVDVKSIAHKDCLLALWITNFHLAHGHQMEILKAWDFIPVTIITWRKNHMGRGQVARGKTEQIIIARRGKPTIEVGSFTTELVADIDRKQHSLKPQKFYGDFEKLVPAPRYATLFETVDRGAKWDGHGDKVAKPKRSGVFTPSDLLAAASEPDPVSDKTRIAGDELAVLESSVSPVVPEALLRANFRDQETPLRRASDEFKSEAVE